MSPWLPEDWAKQAVAIEARFDKYRQWKEYAEDRIRDIEKLN